MADRSVLSYIALLALGAVVLATIVVIAALGMGSGTSSHPVPKEPYYVVRRGDALARIADKTGVPVDELMKLNPKADPLALVPGQRIRLRASAPPPARRRPRPHVPRRPYWVVRKGDLLWKIARKTDVPLYRLLALNPKLRPERMKPGQRIRLRPRAGAPAHERSLEAQQRAAAQSY